MPKVLAMMPTPEVPNERLLDRLGELMDKASAYKSAAFAKPQ